MIIYIKKSVVIGVSILSTISMTGCANANVGFLSKKNPSGELVQQSPVDNHSVNQATNNGVGINNIITQSQHDFIQNYNRAKNIKSKHIPILYQAEITATPAAKSVLSKARIMSLEDKEIIKGGCWDYLNTVFDRAGVQRHSLFKQSKNSGKYYNINHIKPGDWLYHINHSYHDVEHSGMFVGWVDKSKRRGLTLSYAGENRREPARYRVYDLSHVYNVMRPY